MSIVGFDVTDADGNMYSVVDKVDGAFILLNNKGELVYIQAVSFCKNFKLNNWE